MANNENKLIFPEIYNPKLTWHIIPDKLEYIQVLKEQGVSNFDPIAFYKEANDNKNIKKISKAAQRIIDENNKKRENVFKEDEEKRIKQFMKDIENIDIDILSLRIKSLRSKYGRIKFKCLLLKKFLKKDYNMICHIIFYSLQDDVIDNKELNELKSIIIKKYKSKYESENMIDIQMNKMSSYLDPLDPFAINKMKLDDWQLDVFKKIEKKENIIICAPTSAGKTVCSTYCAVLGNKTLFIVPSDELARQVGGIFRNISNVVVKILTNKEYFDDGEYKVLIGTPKKIEEYIVLNKCLDKFSYAIFDEWHMINSEEGGSLENIFKLIQCPFLILSATLGNPHKLKQWMEQVKNTSVNMIQYKKRFIIQQRYIWNSNKLQHLHPLSCTDMDFIKDDEFLNNDMSFTARDSLDLFYKLKKESNVDHLHPKVILKKDKWDRITLTETIQVEKELKKYLNEEAKKNNDNISKIINEYKIDEKDSEFDLVKLIKILITKKMIPAIFFKINPIDCLNIFKLIVNQLKDQQDIKYPFHYDDLEFRSKYYDTFHKRLELAKKKEELLKDIDIEAHFNELESKIESELLSELKAKYTQIINKRLNKINEQSITSDNMKEFYNKYYKKELEKILSLNKIQYVDKDRPHPEFCFNNMGLNSDDMRKIKRELCKTTNDHIDYTHPFMIGIERGIIPYFKDMELHFQIIAQTLFSQKKIPIVISDESLGYGINLPIRTVVLLGNKNIETIDPVIANQMSGRSGRRGLDNEGNIVYVGVNWKHILRGKFHKLEGTNPINKYTPLPFYFKQFNKTDISNIFQNTLYNFVNNINYDSKETRKNILNKLTISSKQPKNAILIWSCRYFGINSFYLPEIIKTISKYDQYKIFESLISLFNMNDNILSDDDVMYNRFDKDMFTLYEYKTLLATYKRKVIDNYFELSVFKRIATLISIIHMNLIDINKEFSNTLDIIFNRLKEMIKHKLF